MHNDLAPAAMHLGASPISLASGSWDTASELRRESDHGDAADASRPMRREDPPEKRRRSTSP